VLLFRGKSWGTRQPVSLEFVWEKSLKSLQDTWFYYFVNIPSYTNPQPMQVSSTKLWYFVRCIQFSSWIKTKTLLRTSIFFSLYALDVSICQSDIQIGTIGRHVCKPWYLEITALFHNGWYFGKKFENVNAQCRENTYCKFYFLLWWKQIGGHGI